MLGIRIHVVLAAVVTLALLLGPASILAAGFSRGLYVAYAAAGAKFSTQQFASSSQRADNELFQPQKITHSIPKDHSYDFMHPSILV